ncbi:hsc70-interacting protein [Temnothorax longispinosus]|uniref:hsc70-interacting protein n=1 Tax=Temnothorax longispinosus TaxID=300112 RepID=UPI003A9967EC
MEMFNDNVAQQLRTFARHCINNPSLLHDPKLSFIKDLIEHYGGKIPEAKTNDSSDAKTEFESKPAEPQPEPEPASEESEESDLELDMTGVIEPDEDAPQKMGNLTLEPTEEEIAESQAKRSEAVSAFVEKDYEKAIQLYTEAIVLNPQAALLYAKRSQVFLLLNKPNACIRDCNRAIELNPDSAAAHKFRGRAYHLLGKFEEAANDLRLACKLDFDEQADEWLRETTPNARKIEEHKRKKERKAQEKLERERQERLRRAREAAKAREENTRTSQTEAGNTSPGAGDFYQFLKDPDVLQAFEDPEVAEAFKEISTNPSNVLKYQNNPKIMGLINKMASKFGGAGGMPGAAGMNFPGGMPGFPGAGAGRFNPPKPPHDDVGLD